MFFAVPYFKNASFLRDTLQSLIEQSDPQWTAKVFDDSVDSKETDAAKKCVETIADSRIQYHRNSQNIGMAANWNQGLNAIPPNGLGVILHADDRLKKDYVSEMKQVAEAHPEAAAYFCKTDIIGTDGKPGFSLADLYKKILVPKKNILVLQGRAGIKNLIPGNFIFCPSLCYRMSVVGSERFRTDLKMVTDFDFILRLLGNGETLVGFYRCSLFEYRRHTENTTVTLTKNLSRFHEEIALYRSLSGSLSRRGEITLSKKARQMRVVKLNLFFQIVKSLCSFNFSTLKQESKLFLEIL